jgi:Uma2 family endonuclease
MSLAESRLRYTVEEYLELERQSEERHEYLDGQIYEMAGESLAHSRICINLARELSTQLKGKLCEALSANMKVQVQSRSMYVYPALTIVCGEPIFHDQKRDVLTNPRVIFEVLSPSTERYDRGEKFRRYNSQLETLTDYVLISQQLSCVEHFTRQPDNNHWLYSALTEATDTLHIASIDCHLQLSEIYDRVSFPILEETIVEERQC